MAEQRINVVPMVEFVRDAMDLPESGTASVYLQLNGDALLYPVTVPISVSGTASNGSDYTLATNDVVIDNSGRAAIDITAIDDGPGDDGETVIVLIGAPSNAVAGPNSEFTVTLRESNLAPLPSITAEQGGALVTTVTRDGGDVVLTASAGDPQAGDSHSYDWSDSDVALVPAEGYGQSTFTFAPAGLADGVYRVAVEVADNGNPAESASQHRYVRVIATAPSLDAKPTATAMASTMRLKVCVTATTTVRVIISTRRRLPTTWSLASVARHCCKRSRATRWRWAAWRWQAATMRSCRARP